MIFLSACEGKKSHNSYSLKIDTPIYKKSSDTLPNGLQILDDYDSGMLMYYKEVVGTDTLKGGFITCYGIDDSFRYFYLRHGDTLHLLNKTNNLVSPHHTGFLERDFTTCFLTTVDNGNGVLPSYKVFGKTTGRNLFGEGMEANDYRLWHDTLFLLYQTTDSVTLFNVVNKNSKSYLLPNDVKSYPDLQFKSFTKKSFTICYSKKFSGDQLNTKTYFR